MEDKWREYEEALIGMGSNMPDRMAHLGKGLLLLASHPKVSVTAVSSVYQTEPVGYLEQPFFYNMAVKIRTTLSPRKLLALLLDIEKETGRVRGVRWGPRTLDLDLLLFGNQQIEEEGLILPHPRMEERGFVLIPLAEIAPGMILPRSGMRIEDRMIGLKEQGVVKVVYRAEQPGEDSSLERE